MIEISEIIMDGTAKSYTVPDNTHSLAVHAVGGNVAMSTTAGGAAWTIKDGEKEAIDTRTVSGEKVYFTGSSGVKLQIRRLTGLLS